MENFAIISLRRGIYERKYVFVSALFMLYLRIFIDAEIECSIFFFFQMYNLIAKHN